MVKVIIIESERGWGQRDGRLSVRTMTVEAVVARGSLEWK